MSGIVKVKVSRIPLGASITGFQAVGWDSTNSKVVRFDMTAFKGDKGDTGKSAFEIWQLTHPGGTMAEYDAYLKQPATDAAAAANEAAGLANNAAVAANQAAEYAGEAGDYANAAAALAVQKAGSANDAATAANATNEDIQEAEGLRVAAETARNAAEQNRTTAETARVNAEGDATKGRVKAENDRAAAEILRQQQEDVRKSAETARNVASNMYNITLAIPLTAGQYYTSTTARAAVPEGVRKRGLLITYETAAGIWNTEKFKGVTTSTWATASDWEIIYSQKNIEDVELTSAEALNVLYNRITALEKFIAAMVVNTMQADTINIVKSFNLFGDSNMILVRAVAPAVVPDFVGQRYVNTAAKTKYTATGVSSVADWVQD